MLMCSIVLDDYSIQYVIGYIGVPRIWGLKSLHTKYIILIFEYIAL